MNQRQSLLQRYEDLRPALVRLADNLRHAVQTFLKEHHIDVLDVTYRIKEFSSFSEKIERKKYKNPFQEVHDICGLRVIAFYASDLNQIDKIIREEFNVIESENNSQEQDSDRFGYRSQHYIVKVKDDWLSAPNYRGLRDCVAEIQVRTILMHAWADLSHKLAYKEESQIPPEFRRQVYQMSALFELADQQFDRLRVERATYRQRLTSDVPGEAEESFDLEAPLNLDSLKAFLSFYFGERESGDKSAAELLQELDQEKITFSAIVKGYEAIRDVINTQEKETFHDDTGRWAQVGVVRHILDVTHDAWWKKRRDELPSGMVELVVSQRKRLKIGK